MKHNRRWKRIGLLYFAIVFILIPQLSFAYIDPSVTTYAIQAIAGVAVAMGAFFATYGRRFRRKWHEVIGVTEDKKKRKEQRLEIYQDELKAELDACRKEAKPSDQFSERGKAESKGRGRLLTSILCGLGFAITVVFRPILSFYLSNEGEFWFRLDDILWAILILFIGTALLISLIHLLLPQKGKHNIRLLFAVLVCGCAICVYIQNHFMSSYLPLLTGDRIDWGLYSGWGIASIALWGGMFALMIFGFCIRPQMTKSIVYGLFVLLLIVEAMTCCVEWATAKHENVKGTTFFSTEGMYETSDAGNVVVLVSDTFEGTYMNEILALHPEYRDILSDCTYYDSVTGVSVLTYYSYVKLMTGQNFPMGETEQSGVRKCFDQQTLIDQVLKNEYDVAYYTKFSPPASASGKIVNIFDGEMKPDTQSTWAIVRTLLKSTLFQSAPQPVKPIFTVYTSEYDKIKEKNAEGKDLPQPFVEDDHGFYYHIQDHGLTKTDGTHPRYTLVELIGIHHPVVIDTEFNYTEYDDKTTSVYEQKLIAGMASLNLMRAYLDALKAAGTYEQTTVIMMADHGFNMRYYPIMLVKEAGKPQDSFRTDSSPLSIQEDYEQIISRLTAGEAFSDIVSSMNLLKDRIRTAIDYYTVDGTYSGRTIRKSIVKIQGPAAEEDSYHIEKDEFLMKEDFTGNYQPGEPFVFDNTVANNPVYSYGLNKYGVIYGHNAIVEIGFNSQEKRALNLKAVIRNPTGKDQQTIIRMDGKEITREIIPSDSVKECVIELPEKTDRNWMIEMDVPEASLCQKEEGVLSWNDYQSIIIDYALLENR